MKLLSNTTPNLAYRIESETSDHFLLEELFEGVEEYGVVVDRRDNKFCSFGIQLAKDLKAIIKHLLPDKDILVKSQCGIYDTYKIRRSRDNLMTFAISNKMKCPFNLWCNTRAKILNNQATIPKHTIAGVPITDTFMEAETHGVLMYTFPLFSDYTFLCREYHNRGIGYPPAIQHAKLNISDAIFVLMCLINSDVTSYVATIASIRFIINAPDSTFYVEWDLAQRVQHNIYFYIGSRLRGCMYKPLTKYRFSVEYFKEEFMQNVTEYTDALNTELYTF